MKVIYFFWRDDAFAQLCQACADMLTARTHGQTRRVANLTQLFASNLVEQYTDAARELSAVRGGLPIRQLHKWKTTSANGWPKRSRSTRWSAWWS